MPRSVSIKELHGSTGEIVRRAGASRRPLIITDRGEPIAVLARSDALTAERPRRRTLLPSFRAFWQRGERGTLAEDLNDIRGER